MTRCQLLQLAHRAMRFDCCVACASNGEPSWAATASRVQAVVPCARTLRNCPAAALTGDASLRANTASAATPAAVSRVQRSITRVPRRVLAGRIGARPSAAARKGLPRAGASRASITCLCAAPRNNRRSLHDARRRQHRLQPPVARHGCGVIAATNELAIDEHTRHRAPAGQLQQRVLHLAPARVPAHGTRADERRQCACATEETESGVVSVHTNACAELCAPRPRAGGCPAPAARTASGRAPRTAARSSP